MSTFIKRDLPVLIISIFGLLIVAEWFVPTSVTTFFADFKTRMGTFTALMGNTAFGIGTFYGVTAELNMLRRRRTWQQYIISGSFFGIMILMAALIFGLQFPNSVLLPEYKWWYFNTYQYQAQAQYAVMFLYQCGAVYRVLRLRSMETVVLSFCGIAFILRSIPLFVSYVPGLMELGDWVAGAPSMAGTRAATLTASIGGLVVGIRALIGKETATIEVR